MFCLDWVPIVCCLWIKPGSKPNRKLETEQDRLPDNEVINQSNNQSINQSIKQLIIFNYLTIWYYWENIRCLTFLKSSKKIWNQFNEFWTSPPQGAYEQPIKELYLDQPKRVLKWLNEVVVELEVFDLNVFYHEYIFIGLRQFYN